jgi:IS30 family transposase
MSGYSHLSFAERERIAVLRADGLSWRAIARRLGRDPSAITREVKRNALPSGGYQPVYAEGYLMRRQRLASRTQVERQCRFMARTVGLTPPIDTAAIWG